MDKVKAFARSIGLPRIIITALFIFVLILSALYDSQMHMVFSDILKRFGMHGILVLAMVPSIQSGTGPNFALPMGIICGLLGCTLSVEYGFRGMTGFVMAFAISLPISIVVGIAYGKLLNAVKGAEMAIATYTGFSIVQLMSIWWLLFPYKSPQMVWPIGKGLRNTFTLEKTFGGVLDNLWTFQINRIIIPVGLIAFFFFICFLILLFTKSRTGTAILIGGMNPQYAKASGVDIDKGRIIANVLSTTLASLGIIVFSSSYGFVQLYTAPLMMAFPAVAAILIGGATSKRAKISHVLIGVILFQGLLSTSLPLVNKIFPESNISEVIRMVVQNGIILYALTKVRGGE